MPDKNSDFNRMLTELQEATLSAAVDRIIPADEFPSASQSGALQFIGRLLETDLRDVASLFRDGLDALHAEAVASQGKPLHTLSPDQQDAVLDAMHKNAVKADWPLPAASFLSLLVRVTTEGYYSDPLNGGNRDAASWKMVGFDPGANDPAKNSVHAGSTRTGNREIPQ